MPSSSAVVVPLAQPAARTRRTQAERSATTRSALLDATVDSLIQLGYSATTTTEVTRRTQLSPGALLHHFPTKRDLLVASVEHLFARRLAEFRDALADVVGAANPFDQTMDLLWSMFCGPTFVAWVEVRVAARTEPDLMTAVAALDRDFVESVLAIAAELFTDDPVLSAAEVLPTAVGLAFSLLDGLALGALLPSGGWSTPEQILDLFKALVHTSLDTAAPTTPDRAQEDTP